MVSLIKNKPEKIDIRSLDEIAVIRIAKVLEMNVRVDDEKGLVAAPEYCIDDIPYKKFEEAHKKGEIHGDIAILDSKTGKPIKYARTAKSDPKKN